MVNDQLLTSEQIASMKFKVGERLVNHILNKNPQVKLFGGAVRDKILHDHLKTDYCPTDYDLCTTSNSAYRNVIDFIYEHCGNVRSDDTLPNQNYTRPQFQVTKLIVDLFAVSLTDEMTIKFDIVLLETNQSFNCDFDVNSLAMDKRGIGFIHDSEDVYRKLRNVFQAIESKTATFGYRLSEDEKIQEKEKYVLNLRAIRLIRKGWTVCHTWRRYELIPSIPQMCTHCHRDDINIKSVNVRDESISEYCFECFDLFLEN